MGLSWETYVVGEPNSIIMQKGNFWHLRGIRLDFCKLIDKIVLHMKPLYSNAARLAFRRKMHFV